MISDRSPQTSDDLRSTPISGRRAPPWVSSTVALALVAGALVPSSPALAVIGTGLAEVQEQQVERFLRRLVDEDGGDRVWTWETMIHSCTKTLMYGSPEQDPEQSGVRFTPDAQRFLAQCALVKGFRHRTSPYVEPTPVEPRSYTLDRRIGTLAEILDEWVSDTSSQNVGLGERNVDCARWIATQPEWKAMLAKTSGLKTGRESPAVISLLLTCAVSKGYEVRPEKAGEPLKALLEAARAEAEAAKTP